MVRLAHWRAAIIAQSDKCVNLNVETLLEVDPHRDPMYNVLGAGTVRILFKHILPNTIATMMTFIPFTVVSAITAITALDFLGWGLPPPTPSIGELLKQGTANLTTAPWIVTSAFVALVFILAVVTFIGEAVREAFDPRKFTLYR